MRYIAWPIIWTAFYTTLAGAVFPALVGKFWEDAGDWLEKNRGRWLPPLAGAVFVFYLILALTGRPFE